jgi:hypothetical protein
MKKYFRQMFGLRSLLLSVLAAYLLLSLGVRAAQHMAWAPEGTLIEIVVGRVVPGLMK